MNALDRIDAAIAQAHQVEVDLAVVAAYRRLIEHATGHSAPVAGCVLCNGRPRAVVVRTGPTSVRFHRPTSDGLPRGDER